MINDCNKTNLILKYEPELLSIAAIHLSAKMNNIKLVCFLIITCQFELICFFNRKYIRNGTEWKNPTSNGTINSSMAWTKHTSKVRSFLFKKVFNKFTLYCRHLRHGARPVPREDVAERGLAAARKLAQRPDDAQASLPTVLTLSHSFFHICRIHF